MSHLGAQGSNVIGHGTRGAIQIKIVPKVGRIAVVRMDPVDMVSRLNLDDIALAQAQALHTKKYLIYLDDPQDIPHPDRDWCRYWVHPIATTLRAVSIEDGLAETMVHPIYPNAKYANKEPVRSSPILPFHNCYFWFRSSMSLRVRVKRGKDWYDNDNSIEVPIPEILKLDWYDDVEDMDALLELNYGTCTRTHRFTAVIKI
ncbi:hypothetical protein C8Q74DRAFT_1191639 [Fomes fomentarius]|nr:hypothetical protein C8Q74DRAFT_1191639 [Fomes fomentarius]